MSKELTNRMISDFKKYIKQDHLERFENRVKNNVKCYGSEISCIIDVYYPDKSKGICEKRYFFADEKSNDFDYDCPDYVLSAIEAGVESL